MTGPGSRLTVAECRDSGLAAVLVLLLVAYFGGGPRFVLAAILVMVAAMLAPGLFRPWAVAWWGLARLLANVGSRVLLTVIYAALVVPVGSIRRLLGADPMRARQWGGEGSVFVRREKEFRPEDLEVPY